MPIAKPGDSIQASITWRNRNPVPFAPQFNLQLDGIVGPLVQSPEAPAGGRAHVIVSQRMPDWDGRYVNVSIVADGKVLPPSPYLDWALCLRNRFQWPSRSAFAFEWSNPEQTWVYARWTAEHRGLASRVWVGFGIFPIGMTAQLQYYWFEDVNNFAYGSDVWKGGWIDWADNEVWASLPSPPEYWEPFPGGYGIGIYGACWIVQSESPITRRNAGQPPVTREFGDESVVKDTGNPIWKIV